MLLIDEASRVDDGMYQALRPMLAVGDGDLVADEHALREAGVLLRGWEHGGPEWKRVSVAATDCARIEPEFLDEERRRPGNLIFECRV